MGKITTELLRRILETDVKILNELVLIRKENTTSNGLDRNMLLALPNHLRKTIFVLAKIGMGTAEDVAKHTGRARAIESSYLNQLTLQGRVEKSRDGRKAFFKPITVSED